MAKPPFACLGLMPRLCLVVLEPGKFHGVAAAHIIPPHDRIDTQMQRVTLRSFLLEKKSDRPKGRDASALDEK
jgi:hypothetical protein